MPFHELFRDHIIMVDIKEMNDEYYVKLFAKNAFGGIFSIIISLTCL